MFFLVFVAVLVVAGSVIFSEHLTGGTIIISDVAGGGHILVSGLFIFIVVVLGLICYAKRKKDCQMARILES